MIELRLENGTKLDLYPEAKIVWRQENNLFSELGISVPNSLPFTLPATDGNRKALGWVDMVSSPSTPDFGSAQSTSGLVAVLRLGGHDYARGTLKVEKSKHRLEYEVQFVQNVPEWVGKFLPDFDYEGIRNETSGDDYLLPDPPSDVNNDSYPDQDFYFPLISNEFVPGLLVNDMNPGGTPTNQMYCPFAYLKYVLDRICLAANLSLSGDFFEDAEIRDLLVYNQRYLNYIFAAPSGPYYFEDLDIKNHLPKVTASELLDALRNMFGLQVDIVSSTSTRGNRLVISDFKTIKTKAVRTDWTGKADRDYETEHVSLDGYKVSHTIDPDDALGDDIKDFVGGTYISTVNDVASLPPSAANVGDFYYCRRENSYYQWNGSAFVFLSYNYDGYTHAKSGGEDVQWASGADTPQMEMLDRIRVNQAFNEDPRLPAEVLPYGIRFVFRRGWQLDRTGVTQTPLGSSEVVNYALSNIGNYCLRPESPEGTYEVWLKDLIALHANNRRTLSRMLYLELRDLIDFEPDRLILIDYQNYVWKSLETEFTMLGIGVTKAELLRCN
jgi:hypothetical protein